MPAEEPDESYPEDPDEGNGSGGSSTSDPRKCRFKVLLTSVEYRDDGGSANIGDDIRYATTTPFGNTVHADHSDGSFEHGETKQHKALIYQVDDMVCHATTAIQLQARVVESDSFFLDILARDDKGKASKTIHYDCGSDRTVRLLVPVTERRVLDDIVDWTMGAIDGIPEDIEDAVEDLASEGEGDTAVFVFKYKIKSECY